jgi:quercetin dioxygenase-like cupin family protein
MDRLGIAHTTVACIALAVLATSAMLPVVVSDDDGLRPAVQTPPLDQLIGMEGVTVEPLARSSFPDHIEATVRVHLTGETATTEADISHLADVVTAQLTIEPDGFVGWHTHPGPGIVSVVAGALTIVNEVDCVAREYRAGQAFLDVGQGNIHVAYNASGEETRVYGVFLDVPPGVGPTILLEEPGNCPR